MIRALWRIVFVPAMVFTGPGLYAAGQQPGPPVRVPAAQDQRLTFQRQFFDRHFESLHPLPRPDFGGAVAGSKLIGAGSYPTSVVSGDFNGDGHVDFAVANGGTNDIWIYLGNGDNTFQVPRLLQLKKGETPICLATADLRGNGTLDLVVAEYDSSTIAVLLGNGDGTFANEQIYSLPQAPAAIAIDDFNHDGRPDVAIALANYDPYRPIPRLALLTGNGDGTFAQPVITYDPGFFWNGGAAYAIDAGDVNGDGLPDLLITAPLLNTANSVLSGNTTVYLNNGDGTFRVGQTIVSAGALNLPVDGRLADVNGDGCPDALIADLSEVVWVALGDCSGTFGATKAVPMGEAPTALRVADINGDGHLDLIATSAVVQQVDYSYPAGDTISVALGNGKGNFGVAHVYGGNSESFALTVGDFAGNGHPGVVTADVDTDTVSVFANDGTGDLGFPEGLYSGRELYGDVEPFSGYTFADLNGDGIPDGFQLGGYDNFYSMSYLNDGAGHLKAPLRSTFGPGVTNFAMGDYRLGDFRNSGHLDLVAIGISSEYTTASQIIYFQPGNGDGTFGPATQVTATGAGGAMTTGDFNADGKLDFVAVNGGLTHSLTPFMGHGDGTFTAGTVLTFTDANPDVSRVFSGDFNSDGKTDVLVFTTGNGYWTPNSAVWEFDGNGNGTFQAGRQLFTGFQPFVLADLNHDGHPDIARYDTFWPDGTTQTYGPARFTNYLAQADGSFLQASTYAPYGSKTHPWDLLPYLEMGDPLNSSIAADYSGDGNIDELAFQQGNSYNHTGQMLMGNGDGTFTATYDEFVFPQYMYPLYAYHLTGAGFADTILYDGGGRMTMVQRGAAAPALQLALESTVISGTQNCGTIFADVASSSDRTVSLEPVS